MDNESTQGSATNDGATAGISLDCLTPGLATIIVACKALQVLAHIRRLYPSVIGEDESRSLHRQMTVAIELSLSGEEAKELREVYRRPTRAQLVNEEVIMTMARAAMIASGSNEPEQGWDMATVFSQAQSMVWGPVQSTVKRLHDAMVFECEQVDVSADSAYADPRRALYLLSEYWGILRSAAIVASREFFYCVPHPLTPVLVSLRRRIVGCFDRLGEVSGADDARETMLWLLAVLLGGDAFEIQAVEEHFNRRLAETEVFLEETRQELGRRTFDLTFAERGFLGAAHTANDWYSRRSEAQNKAASAYLNGPEFSTLRTNRQFGAASNTEEEVNQPKPFEEHEPIPPNERTIPMSFRRAAKHMGKGNNKDAAEWLSKCVKDGSIRCESISRQSHVFSKKDFSESVWPEILPRSRKNPE